MSAAKEFHCIECGQTAPELYKDYDKGIVKISHCVSSLVLSLDLCLLASLSVSDCVIFEPYV